MNAPVEDGVPETARGETTLQRLRLVAAAALFAFSLLAVCPAPTYRLWQLSIVATEAGAWVAPLGLLFLLGARRSRPTRAAAVLGVVAAGLLLSPALRGLAVFRALPGSGHFTDYTAALLGRHGVDEVASRRLRYGQIGGDSLVLDLYMPPSLERTPPLVLVIHGGSWSGGDPRQLAALNHVLANRGYAVAAVGYRFAPRHTFPAQVEDVRSALAYLRRHARELNVDAARVVLLGRSAGGQLALLAAYTLRDPSIRGAIAFYAPADLVWGWNNPSPPRVHDSRGVLAAYLGGSLDEARDTYRAASPIAWGADAVPTLLIHGGRDELVSIEHSRRLSAALAAADRAHTFIALPWATHGCDFIFRGPCGQISRMAVERFLRSVLPAT